MMFILIASILVLYAFLSVKRLEWGIAAVVLGMPLYLLRFSFGPLPTTVLEGMVIILFCVWLVRCVREKRIRVHTLPSQWRRSSVVLRTFMGAVAVFICASAISVFVSPDPIAGFGLWRAYILEPILFFLVLCTTVSSRATIILILSASVCSALSIALVAVYQKVTGWYIPDPWVAERRVTSLYPYPNAVGLYLAPIIAYGVALAALMGGRMQSNWRRVATLFCAGLILLVCSVAIVFAQTEAAYIALAGALFIFALLSGSRARRYALIGATWIVALVLISPPLLSKIEEKVLLRDWSGQVRRVTWTESVALLSDHWFFGAGLGGYPQAMVPYHTAHYLEIFLYPHSLPLNFWSETGILGLMSFLVIMVCASILLLRAWMVLKRARDREGELIALGLLAALVTIGIHGLVDVPYFKNDLALFFWTLLGLTVVLYTRTISPRISEQCP